MEPQVLAILDERRKLPIYLEKRYSTIIIDEVHERSLNTDLVLLLLKELISRKKSIKVVIMSATLDAETFRKYFNGAPHIHIPGLWKQFWYITANESGRPHPVILRRLRTTMSTLPSLMLNTFMSVSGHKTRQRCQRTTSAIF
jgi:hypothetical protein